MSTDFAPADTVVEAARTVEPILAVHYCCPIITRDGARCRQAIIPYSWDNHIYAITDGELRAAMLAHLIQRHGWTRETIGER